MNLEIANRLVRLRKENHMSQEELAAKIGISRQAVSKWERAEASPDTDNLILLARVYNISLDELLHTTEPVESVQEDMDCLDEKSMWQRFPYPIFVTVLYLTLGFGFGIWKGTWILYVTIPLYYWAAGEVKRWHKRRRKKNAKVDIEAN